MTRMISMQVDVPPDRRLFISVPQDVPVGPAQVIIIRLDQAPPAGTAAEMVSSPLFGLWAGRDDIDFTTRQTPVYVQHQAYKVIPGLEERAPYHRTS